MCNICNKQEAKFAMTGLSGRMCTSCHDAILLARKGHAASAKEYFDSINIQSDTAKSFVENELRESELHPAPAKQTDTEKISVTASPDDTQILNKIVSDIHTVKSILIFFLIMTLIGIGGTLMYVIQIANTFKDLF